MAHLAQFSALAALYGHVGAGPIAIRTLMLTYLLVGGWLVRRLGLDGRGRSIAGVVLLVLSLVPMPPTVRDGWPVVRTLLNAVASGPALVWGLVHGGRPARDGGLVMVTGMRSGTGPRSEVMVGSVLLTRHPR